MSEVSPAADRPTGPDTAVLSARDLTLGYDGPAITDGLDLDLEEGTVTAILGPNGSGKSTLLRALARLLPPRSGSILLDGREIRDQRSRDVARRLGLLPQSPSVSVSLTVEELVRRGRFPHRRWFEAWSKADEAAVTEAMALARVDELCDRPVEQLSGGQRQRAWIAVALAQQTAVMLLDEPTTHLDLAHRLEVLDLLVGLNRRHGRTVVMVLHELNEATRYADRLVVVHGGRIVAAGRPDDVMNEELMWTVFGVRARLIADPFTGRPLCVPEPTPALGLTLEERRP